MNKNESIAEDDELNIDELDRRTESAGSEDFDDSDDLLTDAMSRGLADMEKPDSDDD